MKRTQLEKLTGKKIEGGVANSRGDRNAAMNKREQAQQAKLELLRKRGTSKK